MSRRTSATGRAIRVASMSAGVAGSYLGYLAQTLFLNRDQKSAKLGATHRKAARRMSNEMLELRGPLMKLGQTLSLHTGMLPDETVAELSRLQMSAPGMHPSLVRAQFRASFGRDPEEMFKEFDAKPFAAASLGQVHRARLPNGEEVAVKIQYPAIREAIEGDFAWFRAASLPARITKHFPRAVLDELEAQIVAETDYAREAKNIEFFRERLRPLRFVSVPAVHARQSRGRVLTMSLLRGSHLEQFLAGNPSQALRDTLGSHLFELYYFQLLRMEALHADPHWGNYLFRTDGTIGLVDFGCVKYMPPKLVANLRKVFLYPGRRDSPDFIRLMEERYAGANTRLNAATRRALIRFAECFYGRVYPVGPGSDEAAFDFSEAAFIRDYMKEAANLARAKGALPDLLFMARAEIGLYQTLHRLRARVRTSHIVRRHLPVRG